MSLSVRLIVAALVGVASLGSVSAHAFTYVTVADNCIANNSLNATCAMGALAPNTYYTNDENFEDVGVNSNFVHTYTFSVPVSVIGGAGLQQTIVRFFSDFKSYINPLDLALFDSADNPIGTDYGTDVSANLAAGDYKAVVTGTVVGTAGGDGQYKFTIATVVPIPSAVFLFGAGLVGLAAVARRKGSNAEAAGDALIV